MIPNAGLPLNVDGRAVYPLEPAAHGRRAGRVRATSSASTWWAAAAAPRPSTCALVVEAVGRARSPKRAAAAHPPMLAGAMRAVALQQEPRPLLIGERVNAQGSRKVKDLLLAEDYDGLLQLSPGSRSRAGRTRWTCRSRDRARRRGRPDAPLVKKLATSVEAPLVIDTTEAERDRGGARAYPGRALVNSINMENGRERIDACCRWSRRMARRWSR